MSLFTVQDLQTLASSKGGPHVSIYMHSVMAGPQTRQNAIRYKNLLDQAADQLKESGQSPRQIEALLKNAENLRNNSDFWNYQELGLAVLINESETRILKLPRSFPEESRIGDQFHLTPLLQFLYEGGDFYILALSQGDVRLLKATPNSVQEVDLDEDVPTSLAEALRLDDPQTNLNWHVPSGGAPRGQTGDRSAIFHGHGAGQEDEKARLLNYFHKLDDGIMEMLKDRHAPLVLAGVDELLPFYKEANTYPYLLDAGIPQQPKMLSDEDLHQMAWKVVQPLFNEAKEEVKARYELLKGRADPVAVDDLASVLKAAPYSRVEVLFIDQNAQRWGTFDEQNNQLTFTDAQRPGSRDLIEYAAFETLRNGGIVYAVNAQELPGGAKQVAAILRY